jgi:hypothetical protein
MHRKRQTDEQAARRCEGAYKTHRLADYDVIVVPLLFGMLKHYAISFTLLVLPKVVTAVSNRKCYKAINEIAG